MHYFSSCLCLQGTPSCTSFLNLQGHTYNDTSRLSVEPRRKPRPEFLESTLFCFSLINQMHLIFQDIIAVISCSSCSAYPMYLLAFFKFFTSCDLCKLRTSPDPIEESWVPKKTKFSTNVFLRLIFIRNHLQMFNFS